MKNPPACRDPFFRDEVERQFLEDVYRDLVAVVDFGKDAR